MVSAMGTVDFTSMVFEMNGTNVKSKKKTGKPVLYLTYSLLSMQKVVYSKLYHHSYLPNFCSFLEVFKFIKG
jgi:hypothetical protein